MESHSPSADRIGAALRALRRTHADEPGGMAALSLKCLQAVVAELAAEGVAPEDLQPLADLQGRLARRVSDSAGSASGPGAAPTGTKRDRRHGTPPSPTLLARAAVMIDLLVRAGQDEAEAAQTVMRRLMAAGVPAPAQGGDSRGWRRLLEYRYTLLHGGGTDDAKFEYRAFAREIEAIPPAERVSRVLDDRLWDRRREPRRT